MSEIEYRFNNGRGAVLCRKCRVIIDEDISWVDAHRFYSGKDICEKCKRKEKDNNNKPDER